MESLSRAAEDPEASTETWGYLLPPDPQPRLQDLQANENEIPDDEKRWLVQVPEGTWHHVQTHRLWIPPVWREALCRKSLQTPVALQTVSIDFVGPRQVGVVSWWYVVILDHCTRFAFVDFHLWSTGRPHLGSRLDLLSRLQGVGTSRTWSSRGSDESRISTRKRSERNRPSHFGKVFGHPGPKRIGSSFPRLVGRGHTRLQHGAECRHWLFSLLPALRQRTLSAWPPESFSLKIGDHVVYYLSEWQRRIEKEKGHLHQYTCDWSLPHIVTDLEGSRVVVRPLGHRRGPLRQVPLRLIKILKAADQAGERQERQEMQEATETIGSSSSPRDKRHKPGKDHEDP
eukprot:GHVS01001342.1.p1 GENE.GHVS01001342.1~~GHVS01001342.1.p1  ORF type:complete len:343 (+),score=15.42 GHVS01001342.1:683-1711(+)